MTERYPRDTTRRKLNDYAWKKNREAIVRANSRFTLLEQVKSGIFYGFLVSLALGFFMASFSVIYGLYSSTRLPPRDSSFQYIGGK